MRVIFADHVADDARAFLVARGGIELEQRRRRRCEGIAEFDRRQARGLTGRSETPCR
jgi:hypothetical protein